MNLEDLSFCSSCIDKKVPVHLGKKSYLPTFVDSEVVFCRRCGANRTDSEIRKGDPQYTALIKKIGTWKERANMEETLKDLELAELLSDFCARAGARGRP